MHWGEAVSQRVEAFGPLVLGIDPAPSNAPSVLGSDPETFLLGCTEALLEGADGQVGFVKFQSAFFEAFGSVGIVALAKCIALARERRFAVILDAKRGDIGSTAAAYARSYLTPGAGDLEVDFVLALEKDLPVVDAAGEVHDAESTDEFVAPEPQGSGRPKGQIGDSACHTPSVP